MCYSAQVEMDLKEMAKTEVAKVDTAAFEKLFEWRLDSSHDGVPKALEWNYNLPSTPHERRMRELIETYRERRKLEHEEGIEKQKAKIADAERRAAKKPSKTSTEEIATGHRRIEWHKFKLEDQVRVERKERDQFIFPRFYAPIVHLEGGERIIRPMRYLCHPHNRGDSFPTGEFYKKGPKAGQEKINTFDEEYPGCYNARRDNLRYFWKGVFGDAHAYMIITSFFENVFRHSYEKRELRPGEKESTVMIRYNPNPRVRMKVACIWSIWKSEDNPDLWSYAAVTDEPTAQIAATGHDRALIPLNDQNLKIWLDPVTNSADGTFKALDNMEMPDLTHLQHREFKLAA